MTPTNLKMEMKSAKNMRKRKGAVGTPRPRNISARLCWRASRSSDVPKATCSLVMKAGERLLSKWPSGPAFTVQGWVAD